MKTRILLIRHAKTVANKNGLFGGITDYPLCDEGFEQAEQLAEKLLNVKVDKIYSSPLLRANQTIAPYAEKVNKEIIIEDDLKEINVGSWEDVPRNELRKKYPEINKKIDETEYYCGMEGQEETIDVAKRMKDVISKIAKENVGKDIVIVSHIVAIRAFLCSILDIPFEQTKDKIGNIANTGITDIDFIDNNFIVNSIGNK